MILESRAASVSGLLGYRGTSQGAFSQLAVPHWMDFNLGVGLSGAIQGVTNGLVAQLIMPSQGK